MQLQMWQICPFSVAANQPSNKHLVQTFSSAAYLVITRYIACFPHIIVLFALLAFVHNAAFIQSVFIRSQSSINDSVHQQSTVFQCSDKCGNSTLFLQQPPKQQLSSTVCKHQPISSKQLVCKHAIVFLSSAYLVITTHIDCFQHSFTHNSSF